MSLLFRIVFAAHGRGTHHKLALHALERLAGAERDGWQRLFFVHAETYVLGAKKPDDEFKDFKNHVLHPRDGYWGGAVDSARTWYANLVTLLKANAWSEAVLAAGVLSHYLADPLHPFHTAQSDAENSIHRACEWSINRSYDALYAAGITAHPDFVRRLPRDPNWLARLQCESADISNAHYERLIAHYDLTRGVADPPTGLDATARKLCGDLLVTAAATIAAVLEHAIDEAGVHPPPVNVALPAILAAVRIPQNQLLKRVDNAAERTAIQAIYDELRATSAVVEALPLESRTIRDSYASEVAAQKTKPDAAKLFPLPAETVTYTLPIAGPKAATPSRQELAVSPVARAVDLQLPAGATATAPAAASTDKIHTDRALRLTLESDVVDAPSIGPKTAERLNAHGIRTIGDLLAADAAALAKAVDQRHIMSSTIRDWQDQTRLVLAVPSLTGTAAQIFVGAGFRTPEALAAADPTSVNAAVLAFVASAEGRRILRDGAAPDAGKIEAWHARARAA